MGKTSLAARALLYKSDGIVVDNKELISVLCGVSVANTKFQVEQHIKAQKHKQNFELKKKYQTISGMKTQNEFGRDLCQLFVRCNIPLRKLDNSAVKEFLMKYTSRNVPNESTIRKNYVESEYLKTIDKVREEIGDSCIWASVDETTDIEERYIANIIIGKLESESESKAYLIHCLHLDKTNSETIGRALNEAFEILWPNRIQYDEVLVLVTDAAPYMCKAARDLSAVLYTKMVHVTCLAHAIHRVADCIRGEYRKADSVVSQLKKVFLKAPYRKQKLKEMYPEIRQVPSPVITGWGTWLEAVKYYATEWNKIKDVVDHLEEDAVAVTESKKLLSDDKVFGEIALINRHYSFLTDTLTKLQNRGQSVKDTLEIFQEACTALNSAPNNVVKKKDQSSYRQKSWFSHLQSIEFK